jgi:transposase
MPLSLLVTAANTPDAAVFEALLDDLPKVCTPRGGRRHRPVKVHADKAYDNRHCRSYLTRRGIKVRIARRGVESSTRLGRHRWKAERSIAWLAGCRRLRVRYDRDSERFFAFAMLGCARLCYNRWVSTVSGPQQPRSPPHPQFRNVLLCLPNKMPSWEPASAAFTISGTLPKPHGRRPTGLLTRCFASRGDGTVRAGIGWRRSHILRRTTVDVWLRDEKGLERLRPSGRPTEGSQQPLGAWAGP